MIHRGDIYYIQDRSYTRGSEQGGDRPGVIVSNDANNKHSPVVEVVFLTCKNKKQLPTHVPIKSAKYPSTALCENVYSVSVQTLGNYVGHCTDKEMQQINNALQVSLGLETLYLIF